MEQIELLMNIIKDYDNDIDYLHGQVIELYSELSNCRNKRAEVKNLIKQLMDNKYE